MEAGRVDGVSETGKDEAGFVVVDEEMDGSGEASGVPVLPSQICRGVKVATMQSTPRPVCSAFLKELARFVSRSLSHYLWTRLALLDASTLLFREPGCDKDAASAPKEISKTNHTIHSWHASTHPIIVYKLGSSLPRWLNTATNRHCPQEHTLGSDGEHEVDQNS
ncbi:unnamed protein product [Pleuronectes platessa]|uniref:Uncharacterized protein n=1 Tax=Pleuronectes platessa TaxID=8262 RepID=A0A9N7UPY6_PLEPL|nr:unnamed protein product [Pleuronectes platessa]